MRIYDLIAKKRDGGTHSREELEAIVNGFVSGEVADYQTAAWMWSLRAWRLALSWLWEFSSSFIDSSELSELKNFWNWPRGLIENATGSIAN